MIGSSLLEKSARPLRHQKQRSAQSEWRAADDDATNVVASHKGIASVAGRGRSIASKLPNRGRFWDSHTSATARISVHCGAATAAEMLAVRSVDDQVEA